MSTTIDTPPSGDPVPSPNPIPSAGARDRSTDDAVVAFRAAGKCFDDTWVVDDLDLVVPPGRIFGMIGPSGCGKTTTVRMANGFYAADAGEVRTFGTDPAELGARDRARLGYLPQQPVLFDELSLWENLNFHASLNGVRSRRRNRLRELLELVDLDGDESKLVGQASGGMQRRLALAATLVHRPELLMLDEPTAGIDPILRRRFWEHFRELRDGGTTMIITTQFVSEAADCDLVAMLAHGCVAAVGTPDELKRRAYGGTLVDLEFDRPVGHDDLNVLGRLEGVGETTVRDECVVRAAIDRERITAAEIGERLTADLMNSTEVATDWDDVFIRLVGDGEADCPPIGDDDADGPNSDDPSAGEMLRHDEEATS